jgi:hypothetical protein
MAMIAMMAILGFISVLAIGILVSVAIEEVKGGKGK